MSQLRAHPVMRAPQRGRAHPAHRSAFRYYGARGMN